jgi:predicted PurR-regulated permease PerM
MAGDLRGLGPGGFREAWQRVPLSLRVAGLISGCLLLLAGALYVVAFVTGRLASLSIALAAAFLIAALLDPIVVGLHRLRVPRGLGALLALLLLVAVFVAPAILLWNLTAGQFSGVVGRLREGVARARDAAADLLPVNDAQFDILVADVEARVQRLVVDAVAGALSLLEALAAVALALFVAFFLLKDGPTMWSWTLAQMPRGRAAAGQAGEAAWDTLTRYVRGILIIAVIDALGIGIALAVIGVPLALPLALLVFVGSFVPYVGSTVSGAVAVVVAFATNGPVDALLVLAAVILVQQLEGNLLEPFIVGWQVRLHPVVVVVVVFAGSLVAGIPGAVLAVPLTAVIYRVARVLQERRAERRVATGVPSQGPAPDEPATAGGPAPPEQRSAPV